MLLRTAAPRRAGAARLAFALSLALGALGSGCSDTIPPAFEIEGRRMVVIPLRDALQNHYFSPRGNQLTRSLTFNLERLHEEEPDDVIEVVPFDELVGAVGREDPTAIRPEDMAKRVRATCFLMGSITRFDTRLPGDIGIARGRAEVQIKVFDTDRPLGRELLDTKIAVSFPPEGLTSLGVLPPSEVNEKDIENGLYAALVDKLSKLFRYHEPEKRDR